MRMDLWSVPPADGGTLGAVVQFRHCRRLFTRGQPVYEAPRKNGFASVLAVSGSWLVLQVCWLLCMLAVEHHLRFPNGQEARLAAAYLSALQFSKCKSSTPVSTAEVIAEMFRLRSEFFDGG